MQRVVVLVVDEVQALDAVGPVEVLHRAGGYALEVVAPEGRAVATTSGLRLGAAPLPAPAPADTLLVAGGEGTRRQLRDPDLIAWVREQAARCDRVVSVCTGAFVLAAAGLLDGRRATTHWAWCPALARAFPAVDVRPDPIFVRDGDVWTSAGVTAGMDLALALVEEDRGAELALEVARDLVLFLKRPGGQAQFSGVLLAQTAARGPVREAQAWAAQNLAGDLGVPALAARAGRSERQLTRLFTQEVGMSPAAWVETLRIERARALLTSTPLGVEAVARETGFASAEVLRRAFHRRTGVSPAEFRRRFAA